MSEQELADLASKVDRTLKWAVLVLAALAAIVIIDLQLKQAVARQAVSASEKYAALIRMTDRITADLKPEGAQRGRSASTAGSSSGDPDPAVSSDVVSDAGMAAGPDGAGGAPPGVPDAAPAGPRKRAPGNGRRTPRTPQ